MIAKLKNLHRRGPLRLPRLAAFFLFVAWGFFPTVALSAVTLTNASAVLALSADEASSGLPVSVVGVVTAAEASWTGRFFVQDSSGGIFVQLLTNSQPIPGDIVQVWGISSKGRYAPVISRPHWTK